MPEFPAEKGNSAGMENVLTPAEKRAAQQTNTAEMAAVKRPPVGSSVPTARSVCTAMGNAISIGVRRERPANLAEFAIKTAVWTILAEVFSVLSPGRSVDMESV